jgi:hypothetical protein
MYRSLLVVNKALTAYINSLATISIS